MNIQDLSKELFNIFATDQRYYLKQQEDGTYKKISGLVTTPFIEKKIKEGDSFTIYQKNIDSSVKWICYDFDVLKKHLNQETYNEAIKELLKVNL